MNWYWKVQISDWPSPSPDGPDGEALIRLFAKWNREEADRRRRTAAESTATCENRQEG